MPSCTFGASLAAARLHDLVLDQGAPLFVVHSFVVLCTYPWVPSCPFGASLAAARLHDLVHFRATVGGLAQVMLLYAAKQHTYVIFLIFFLDLPA